jgi:hypothetical protein
MKTIIAPAAVSSRSPLLSMLAVPGITRRRCFAGLAVAACLFIPVSVKANVFLQNLTYRIQDFGYGGSVVLGGFAFSREADVLSPAHNPWCGRYRSPSSSEATVILARQLIQPVIVMDQQLS